MSTWEGRLRVIAVVEAVTLLCLLGAVISYRVFDGPDWTATIGPVHGLAFVAYFVAVIQTREDLGWSARRTVAIVIAAVIPAGGFVIARRLASAPDDQVTGATQSSSP